MGDTLAPISSGLPAKPKPVESTSKATPKIEIVIGKAQIEEPEYEITVGKAQIEEPAYEVTVGEAQIIEPKQNSSTGVSPPKPFLSLTKRS